MSETDAMLQDLPWDDHERSEIIAYIPIDSDAYFAYLQEKLQILEGCCFALNNFRNPWRWEDQEGQLKSRYLAVSNHNIMYLQTKYPVHKLNPCPPCMCCAKGNYLEDFAPKSRKAIPIEKITDIEVKDAGSNELVKPGCRCPPACNPISVVVPVSQAFVNTAGSNGPELVIEGIRDASAFRRLVMDIKKGMGPASGLSSAPGQMGMSNPPTSLGSSSEVVSLLRDIAESNRRIEQALQKQ